MSTSLVQIVVRITCQAAILSILFSTATAQVYHVKEMNTGQVRALDRDKTVVLLPGGILEEHGPYLPSFTDGYATERLTQDLAGAIVERPGWKALIFPMVPLGSGAANEIGCQYPFSGSFTVRSATLRAVFMDLATELGDQGFRWIFVVNLHGGPHHNRALDQACEYFRDTYGGHMVNLTGLMATGPNREEFVASLPEKERQEEGFAVHADAAETSLMLFLQPDLVNPAHQQAPALTGRNLGDLVRIAKVEGWPGYFGSPRLATAARGARMWRGYSARVVEYALKILDGFDDRQLPRYADVMLSTLASVGMDKVVLEHEEKIEKKQSDWLEKRKVQ